MIWKKQQVLDYLNKEQWDKRYKCDVYSPTRTVAQNDLMWGRLGDISKWFIDKWIFISQNELHEEFKRKFIKPKYKKSKLTWKRYRLEKTTTNLSKIEFSQYLKDIDWYLYQTYELIVLKKPELMEYN